MKAYIKRLYRKIYPKSITWKEVRELILEEITKNEEPEALYFTAEEPISCQKDETVRIYFNWKNMTCRIVKIAKEEVNNARDEGSKQGKV